MFDYSITCNVLEIYNEKVRDLLTIPSEGAIDRYSFDSYHLTLSLEIRQGPQGLIIENVTHVSVNVELFHCSHLTILEQ
jgi:hypothetical protein